MPSRFDAGSLALLRALGARKGYDVERARMWDCVRVTGSDGVTILAPSGAAAFTPAEARAFLAGAARRMTPDELKAAWQAQRASYLALPRLP